MKEKSLIETAKMQGHVMVRRLFFSLSFFFFVF